MADAPCTPNSARSGVCSPALTGLLQLPDHALELVLGHLAVQDLARFGMVCKGAHDALQHASSLILTKPWWSGKPEAYVSDQQEIEAVCRCWKGQVHFAERLALQHGRVQKLTLSYQRHGPDEGVTYPGQTYAASLLVACSASLQQLKWKLQFPGPGPGSKILLGLLANMHQLCVLHVHLDSCYLKEIVLAGQHVEEVSLHGGSHSDCVALQRQSAEDDDPICDSDALVASIAPQRIEAATGLPQVRMRILRLKSMTLEHTSNAPTVFWPKSLEQLHLDNIWSLPEGCCVMPPNLVQLHMRGPTFTHAMCLPSTLRVLELDDMGLSSPTMFAGLLQLRILRLLGCELKRESAWHIDEHARVDLIKGIREPWSSRLPQYLAQMLHLEQRTVSVKPCHIGSSVLGDDLGSRFPQLQRLEVHLDTRSAWPDWWEEFGEERMYESGLAHVERHHWENLGLAVISHDSLRELKLIAGNPNGEESCGPDYDIKINCPQLRSVTFDARAAAMLGSLQLACPGLTDITIGLGRSADCFAAMLAQPTGLRRLSVQEERDATRPGNAFAYLAMHPGLRHLTALLEREDMVALSEQRLPVLESMQLALLCWAEQLSLQKRVQIQKMAETIWQGFSRNCPQLRNLAMKVTYRDFVGFSHQHMPMLKSLHLHADALYEASMGLCFELIQQRSQVTWERIGENCPKLKRVSVQMPAAGRAQGGAYHPAGLVAAIQGLFALGSRFYISVQDDPL